ncbi:hypothetical protein LJR235_001875 [Pararhizobium sp. LjRoot235]|uniref:hypothetical protein n=1 Tax=Pararhizobium sp. LjRoot235 TaxID=3342291 RepID=UPI003ECC4EAE
MINYIATSKFSRDDSASEFKVAIDASIPGVYSQYIQSAYEFLARVSGRAVVFDIVSTAGDVFSRNDRYIYIGREDYYYNHNIKQNPFVSKLKSSINREFPNGKDRIFWEDLNARLGIFFGTPLFFNAEFSSIDYDAVILRGAKHLLDNKRIEKTAVYVNIPKLDGLNTTEIDAFTKYISIQEIFQEYNLASDIADEALKLKTILYDHDVVLKDSTGALRLAELHRNAAAGLCLYDVMLTSQLYNEGSGLKPIGALSYLKMYMEAYWYRLTSSADLFDSRCW